MAIGIVNRLPQNETNDLLLTVNRRILGQNPPKLRIETRMMATASLAGGEPKIRTGFDEINVSIAPINPAHAESI